MTLDRTYLTLGDNNTQLTPTWENEFKNKINEITENAIDLSFIKDHIYGFKYEHINTTSCRINAGVCRDETNVDTIRLTSNRTINFANAGVANGIESSSLMQGVKAFYIYVIKNSQSGQVDCFASHRTNPILPAGYDRKRLVGVGMNNSSSISLMRLHAFGLGSKREYVFDAQRSLLSGGSATSFTNVTVSAAPVEVKHLLVIRAIVRGSGSPASTNNFNFHVRNPDLIESGSDGTIVITGRASSSVATGDNALRFLISANSNKIIQYKMEPTGNSPLLDLSHQGFIVEL